MSRKYQVGIQQTVLEIIQQSKKMNPRLRYIATSQIVTEMQRVAPHINNPEIKIKQALYHLQQETKLKKQRIKKVYSRNGIRKGWTPFYNTEKDKE